MFRFFKKNGKGGKQKMTSLKENSLLSPAETTRVEAVEVLKIAAQRRGDEEDNALLLAKQIMKQLRPEAAEIITLALMMQKRAAENDPLTGLKNRNWLMRKGKLIEKQDSRGRISLAPSDGLQLFLDLDDFGLRNKWYGEIEGDEVLAQFAKLLKQRFSKIADSIRFGGEEFLVLAKEGVTELEILEADGLLRQDLEKEEFASGPLTYSAGVGETYIEVNDQLLLAKKMGKNRTRYGRKPALEKAPEDTPEYGQLAPERYSVSLGDSRKHSPAWAASELSVSANRYEYITSCTSNF